MDKEQSLARLHAALGMKRLNRPWAKIEILFGLTSTGIGIWLGVQTAGSPYYAVGGLLLYVFGGYLALAGNRSLLYQSNNDLTAYLAEQRCGNVSHS